MLNLDPASEKLMFSVPVEKQFLTPSQSTLSMNQMVDTIGPSKPSHEKWKPERPLLVPPDQLPLRKAFPSSEYRFLAVTDESRHLGDQILSTLGVRMANIKSKIQEISAESIQKLKESSDRVKDSNWWSVLKKIATCLFSALSVLLGTTLVASGGGALIGGAMIVSGIFSLANFALSESQAWDWVAKQICQDNEDLRRKLVMILPMVFGILAGGIGLVGSLHSLATGAIQFAEKGIYLAQTVLSTFNGLTTLGKGQADARLAWAQASQIETQAKLTVERFHFDNLICALENSLSDFREVKNRARKIMQIILHSNVELIQQA